MINKVIYVIKLNKEKQLTFKEEVAQGIFESYD